jgi:hypothetical protein
MQNNSEEEEGDRVYYDKMVQKTRDAFRKIHKERTGGRRMSRRRKQVVRRSRRASSRSRK